MVRESQDVVTYASTYALVALSLDRLHAIARPLGFTSSSKSLNFLVVIAIVMVVAVVVICFNVIGVFIFIKYY